MSPATTSTRLWYQVGNIQEEILSHEAHTLKLRNSTIISFTPDDVPLPPAPTFTHYLSTLHINGIPITIIYWVIIYASSKVDGPWKSGHWNILKSHHSEWKVCCRMNYKVIVNRLKEL
jgi:hypothetical protein